MSSIDVSKGDITNIYNFKSNDNVELNIKANSIDISSLNHKSYKMDKDNNFRDLIKFVIDSFLSVINIPLFTRIGLRYIDECPVPSRNKEEFLSYYNTTFPLDRFSLETTNKISFATEISIEDKNLRYAESLKKIDGKDVLIMDFDASSNNVPVGQYIDVLDSLHQIIRKEYELSIKEPVIEYMKGDSDE